MSEHVIAVRPRYGEVDRMGFAYHAHYLAWFDMGRTEAMRARGMPYADVEARGFFLVVAEARVNYLSPARYDESLTLTTRIERVGGASVTFTYTLTGPEGELRATGLTRLGSTDTQGRPCRLPQDLRALLSPGSPPPDGTSKPL